MKNWNNGIREAEDYIQEIQWNKTFKRNDEYNNIKEENFIKQRDVFYIIII